MNILAKWQHNRILLQVSRKLTLKLASSKNTHHLGGKLAQPSEWWEKDRMQNLAAGVASAVNALCDITNSFWECFAFFLVKIKKKKKKSSNKNKQECIIYFYFFGELTEILEKVFSVGLSVTSAVMKSWKRLQPAALKRTWRGRGGDPSKPINALSKKGKYVLFVFLLCRLQQCTATGQLTPG